MFKMNATKLAAPDGMNVKTFLAGQEYPKTELSQEIFDAFKLRGELTEMVAFEVAVPETVPDTVPETEQNILPTVQDVHKAKRGAK